MAADNWSVTCCLNPVTKEVAVGLLNGLVWAVIVAIVTRVFFSTWVVGIIIAAALAINLLVAAFAGFGDQLLAVVWVGRAILNSFFNTISVIRSCSEWHGKTTDT